LASATATITAILSEMAALRAHVKNGHFVVDQSTELPEGTEVELALTRRVDPFADMDPEERAELERELEEGARDFENGDHVDAREFVSRLLAKP
jgi:hypothetical protein